MRPRTIVFVVDASSSMDDIQHDVQSALIEYIDGLQPGDQCVLFAFGDEVRQVASHVIGKDEDREWLKSKVADIQATDRYTDITTALERGLRALKRNAAGRPDYLPMLVLLTDGRHNPHDPQAAPTFQSLTELYPDFLPGRDWYLHYIILKPNIDDPDALAFINWARGALTTLDDIGNLQASLGMLTTPAHITLTDCVDRCSMRPASQPGWQPVEATATVSTGDVVETGPDSRALLRIEDAVRVGLDPATELTIEVATWDPLRQEGRLAATLRAGTIEVLTKDPEKHWHVALATSTAQVQPLGTRFRLTVSPGDGETLLQVRNGEVQLAGSQGTQRVGRIKQARVSADGTVNDASEWSTEAMGLSRAWDEPLDGQPLGEHGAGFARAVWEAIRWDVGPLEAGKTWTRNATISLAGLPRDAVNRAAVRVQTSVADGLAVNAQLVRPAPVGPHEVRLTVVSAQDYVPQPETAYTGRVALVIGDQEEVAAFPLRLWTGAAPLTRAVEAPPPTRGGWGIIIALGVCGVLIVVFIVGIQPRLRGRGPTEGTGRLLVLENPVPKTWQVDFISLDPYFRKKRDAKITIGRSTYCDIVLPHASVEEHHCNFLARKTNAGTQMEVETIRDATVTLNDDLSTGKFMIGDRAQIGIGEFRLQYEDSAAKPQVLVHMKDGKAVRGALHTWDMRATSFLMAPNDADVKLIGGPMRDIAFADVQDIAMLRMGSGVRKQKAPQGRTVTIRFPGGRSLSGILWADYDPKSALFTLFPNDNPDVDYVVVVRANTESVDTGDEIPDYPDEFIS